MDGVGGEEEDELGWELPPLPVVILLTSATQMRGGEEGRRGKFGASVGGGCWLAGRVC